MALVWKPCLIPQLPSFMARSPIAESPRSSPARPAAAERGGAAAAPRSRSAAETRISLVLALAAQSAAASQRILGDLVVETAKYAFPRRYEARNLEEALMSVPDLETVKYRVIKRMDYYEIREVEDKELLTLFIDDDGVNALCRRLLLSCIVLLLIFAFLTLYSLILLPRRQCLDRLDLISMAHLNLLMSWLLIYLNTASEQMEMTTPVYTRKVQPSGEKMDMTTPVITKRSPEQDKWQMSFVMPSKYGSNLPVPKDSSVSIKEVPGKIVAVTSFSGFVTDEDVKRREAKLRNVLRSDAQFRVKEDALVEVAQFNPPFTLPFTRRNEIALEVERKAE